MNKYLLAICFALSLSSFHLAGMLSHLVQFYTKDLAEVMATWQYVHIFYVIGFIFAVPPLYVFWQKFGRFL